MSKLFYRQLGSGPPLFILHGLYGSSDNWISIARHLADRFTVYLPDARNHGQSQHAASHTFDDMAGDLAQLMDDLRIYSAYLAGHSMGGKTAINFTALYPERVKKLMVIDISPRTYSPLTNDNQVENHQLIISALLTVDPSVITSRQQADEVLSQSITDMTLRQFLLKNLHRDVDGRYSWRLNRAILQKYLPEIMKGFEQQINDLHFYKNPVLFLKGGRSAYIDQAGEQLIHQIFPQASIETIDGAGHWLHAENPAVVIDFFNQFFSK